MEYVVITGATSGIGYELAKLFAKDGYGLILISSNQKHLNEAKKALEEYRDILIYTFEQDLTQKGSARKLHQRISEKNLPIKIIVNNAGFGLLGATEKIDLDQDESMIMLNVMNLVLLCKLFIADLYHNGGGKILNVSSTGAFQPGPYTSTYYASKAFVLSYTRAIRYEAKSKGVIVSTLCPGTTDTNFFIREGMKTPKYAMSAKKVAAITFRGLQKNKEIIVPGWINKLLRLVPQRIKIIGIAKLKQKKKVIN